MKKESRNEFSIVDKMDNKLQKVGLFIFLLTSITMAYDSLNCHCPKYEELQSPSQYTLKDLIKCDRCRKRLRIVLNSCNHPLLIHYSSIDVNKLNSEQFSILIYLQKECFKFQEEHGHFSNVCSNTFIDTIKNDNIKSNLFKYAELITEQCGHMKDDLDDDTIAMKVKWTDWQSDNQVFEGTFKMPLSGKPFIKSGTIFLPISILSSSAMFYYDYLLYNNKIDFVNTKSEGTQWLAVIGFGFLNLAAIVLPPLSIGMLSFGFHQENKIEKYQNEIKIIQKNTLNSIPQLKYTINFR